MPVVDDLIAANSRIRESARAVGEALAAVEVYTEPAIARAVQAEHNLYARIDAEFGMLSSADAGRRMGSRSSAPRNLATTAHRAGTLVAVHRGNYLAYPGFQFDPDGQPLPVIARLRDVAAAAAGPRPAWCNGSARRPPTSTVTGRWIISARTRIGWSQWPRRPCLLVVTRPPSPVRTGRHQSACRTTALPRAVIDAHGNRVQPGLGAPTRFAFFGNPVVPVMYTAESEDAAIAETLLHDIPADGGVLPYDQYAGTALVRLEVTRALRLAVLHGIGLRQLKASAHAVTAEPGIDLSRHRCVGRSGAQRRPGRAGVDVADVQ